MKLCRHDILEAECMKCSNENGTEPVALIDMDGTLSDYIGSLTRELSLLMGPNEGLPVDLRKAERECEWFARRMDLIKEQAGFWRNLKPIKRGFAVYDLLGELGYRRMVLTKGPRKSVNAWTEKVQWCREHIPEADITITHDKGLVYGKVLFDDWPPYIERWLEYRPRGKVIMPHHDWNATWEHDQVFRYRDEGDLLAVRAFLNE